MTFKDAVLNTTTEARTENGMKALESSLSNNVDLFYKIGASRGKNILVEFEKAYLENKETALRIAQWARDIRGGAGERQLFRDILLFLEKKYKDDLLNTKILSNVPVIGRWDDLLIFQTKEVKEKSFTMIKNALEGGNGLAAKWMPRKGLVAEELRQFFGMTPKQYRKTLVNLTNVVETQMCSRQWENIVFSQVPSLAMSRYTKAFTKKASISFQEYKNKLEKGEEKINASAVYPYDVIKNLRNGGSISNAQWNSLPNYIGDAMVLPMVDVSGSMYAAAGNGKLNISCLDIAISLGLYCSDKNTGPFKDLFLTFSSNSKFVHLKGNLESKFRQMSIAEWGGSTNLHSAFSEILRVAKTNQVSEKDMPKILLILSDMQFDTCTEYDDSAIEMVNRKYSECGYTVPKIVFWNLNSRDNVPVRFDSNGTALVSGFSPSIMKSILNGNLEKFTPENIMMDAVYIEKYNL